MAAAFEAHQEQETSMIEQRQPVGGAAQKRAEAEKASHKVKLSAQQEAEVELQKRVEKMIRHSVKEDAKKRLQQRVEKMMAKLSKTEPLKTSPWSGKPELSPGKAQILTLKKDPPLTPVQQEALKVKEAAEARLKAAEKAKEDKMAAAFEAHQERETSMIEKRQPVGGAVASKRAQEVEKKEKAAQKVKLSAKEEAKLQLQQRVEKMIRHTDIAVAEKQMEERVQHAKTLLKEEAFILKQSQCPSIFTISSHYMLTCENFLCVRWLLLRPKPRLTKPQRQRPGRLKKPQRQRPGSIRRRRMPGRPRRLRCVRLRWLPRRKRPRCGQWRARARSARGEELLPSKL